MKKLMKILCLVLVLVMVVAPVTSFAANPFEEFTKDDGDAAFTEIKNDVSSLGKGVYSVLQTIGFIVAVCMIVYMGIQWILATPAKKAELKGRMWSMAIGVVLLLGGVGILGILANAVENSEMLK